MPSVPSAEDQSKNSTPRILANVSHYYYIYITSRSH